MNIAISNPPYNIRWEHPEFAQLQSRFAKTPLPPESNANLAFVLTALEKADRCIFVLPCGFLTPSQKEEREIMEYLVTQNLIDAVISCPPKMFEGTDIPVCIVVFDKCKTTSNVTMIDASNYCVQELREQRGQFGGKAHENRVYKKAINTFSDEQIAHISKLCRDHEEDSFCTQVPLKAIKDNNFQLTPKRYIETKYEADKMRSYQDIVADLNRVIKQRNCLKLTINETLAKSLGLSELIDSMKQSHQINLDMSESLRSLKIDGGLKIEKEDYLTLTKNKNELKFQNNSKEQMSEVLLMIMQYWKMMIFHFNNEENRYLAELRDRLLPDLMSGQVEV